MQEFGVRRVRQLGENWKRKLDFSVVVVYSGNSSNPFYPEKFGKKWLENSSLSASGGTEF
ncbi:MAG: hypothetical protein ABH810_02235 [bacterium]